MEAKDGNTAAAISYFQQARTIYTKREDILRVVLEEAEGWVKQGNRNARSSWCGASCRSSPAGRPAELLKKVEQDISPGALEAAKLR